jgi:hypothetical protein
MSCLLSSSHHFWCDNQVIFANRHQITRLLSLEPTNLAVDRWYHCFLAVSSDIDVQVDSAEVAWNSIIPFRM